MFGGTLSDTQASDSTWLFSAELQLESGLRYSSAGWRWTRVEVNGGPGARYLHTLTHFGVNTVMMYGGREDVNILNDTWLFTLDAETGQGGTWKEHRPVPRSYANSTSPTALSYQQDCSAGSKLRRKPPPMHYHAASSIGPGLIVVFGGEGGERGGDDPFSTTWLFQGPNGRSSTDGEWFLPCLRGATNAHPQGRVGHTMSQLAKGKVILYGGYHSVSLNTFCLRDRVLVSFCYCACLCMCVCVFPLYCVYPLLILAYRVMTSTPCAERRIRQCPRRRVDVHAVGGFLRVAQNRSHGAVGPRRCCVGADHGHSRHFCW